MEGRVSEEPETLQRGIAQTCEGLENPQAKRTRVDKNDDSRLPKGKDGSESEGKIYRLSDLDILEDNVDRMLQRGIAHTREGLEKPQAKHTRVDKNDHSGVQKGTDDSESEGKIRRFSDLDILEDKVKRIHRGRTLISVEPKYAEIALKFYEETQGAEFEILDVLFSNRAKLVVPGYEGIGLWCHVSFVAKPRNAGCIDDDSTQRFFGEMLFDPAEEKYNVTYCSIFEPSDPRNVDGCIFCPPHEVYLHPADGCPAGGHTGGCSKRHPQKRNIFLDDVDVKKIEEARKFLHLKYAKTALEFYEKSKDAEFEIKEALFAARKPVVVPGSKCNEEWWCHVTFTAKPKNADCNDISSKYFFGELSRDTTSGKYIASYCEIFEPPSDRKITHGCIICPPLIKHPFEGFCVGHPPHAIAK